jgi:tRNA nucleotidyltransferase/poly(A) polymerase
MSLIQTIQPQIRNLLQAIGRETQNPVYIVGGFVRDLLLARENLDLDIVVEGDAIRFARHLAEKWNGRLQAHPPFGTATITCSDGLKIDFVSARSETYDRPGALPSVKWGTIEDDLWRRDFSINALAIRLNSDDFGALIDCTGGLSDLQAGRIRVLHDRSFIDDPTRIFRAIRYEGRYGFQIIDNDQNLIREAIGQKVLDCVSGQRIRNEIERIFAEEATPQMIRRMREFHLFRAVHPDWEVSPDFDTRWSAAQRAVDWASKHLPMDEIDGDVMWWMTLLTDSSLTSPPAPLSVLVRSDRTTRDTLRPVPHGMSSSRPIGESKDLQGEGGSRAHSSLSLPSPFRGGAGGLSYSHVVQAVCDRLALENRLRTKLIATARLPENLQALSADSKPSEVYQRLKPYPLESLVFALMDENQPDWRVKQLERYLLDHRNVEQLISGDDLIQWGLKPGKGFADVLWKVFAAQLDGHVSTKQEAYQLWKY